MGTNIELNLFDLENLYAVKTWQISKLNSVYALSQFVNYFSFLDSAVTMTIEHVTTDGIVYQEQTKIQPVTFRFSQNENYFYFATINQPIRLIQFAPKLASEQFGNLICNNSSLFFTADNKYFVGYADTSQLHFILYDIESKKKWKKKLKMSILAKK